MRKIRMNESQLTRMVEETTRKVLDELDWKTYANAGRKAELRAKKAMDAVNPDAPIFGDESVLNNIRRTDDFYNRASAQAERDEFSGMSSKYKPVVYQTGNRTESGAYTRNSDAGYPALFRNKDGYRKASYKHSENYDEIPRGFFDNDEDEKIFRRGSQNIEDFNAGKYRYEKGKGWTK